MLLSLSSVNWPVSQNYHNSLWFYRWYNNKQLTLMLCHYIYTVILVFTWEIKYLSHNNFVLFCFERDDPLSPAIPKTFDSSWQYPDIG